MRYNEYMTTLAHIDVDDQDWVDLTTGFINGKDYLIQNDSSSILLLHEAANAPADDEDAFKVEAGDEREITFDNTTPIRGKLLGGVGKVKRNTL